MRKLVSFLTALFLLLSAAPQSARAEKNDEPIRVGYYENGAFQQGAELGAIRRGYAYEYYRKLSEYTGWQYEYVYGGFSDLYQMLLDGQIDLLAGLAKTEERLGVVGYPEFPMGSETYNMVKHSEDDRITTSYSTLNGKKIGEASLAEAYEAIRELAASFDYDSIQLILEELAGSRIPKEKAARHARLAEAAKKPDWDELKKVLAEE